MRLAIGTVQFGLPYGVANTRGQVPPEDVAAILSEARAAGCDTVDTAMAYGEAETVLGAVGVDGWRVVTKLPPVPQDERDVTGWARRAMEQSLTRLRLGSVHGLLLHRPQEIFGPHGAALIAALDAIRAGGLAAHAGVSIWSPGELANLLQAFDFSLVQAPFNHFDRRLITSGWLAKLRDRRIELHVRSIFLQGLLLLPTEARPAAFTRWAPLFDARDQWLQSVSLSAVDAAVGDALAHAEIDRVVVGVETLEQWRQVQAAAASSRLCVSPAALGTEDDELINPARWPARPGLKH
jgi:aryl-alcohol dehydrogenase-like predicted oxidoreductase